MTDADQNAALQNARDIARLALAGGRSLVSACRELWLVVAHDLWEDWKEDRLKEPLKDFGTFTLLADDWEMHKNEPIVRERIERDIRSNLRWVLGEGPHDAEPWNRDLDFVDGHWRLGNHLRTHEQQARPPADLA